MADLARYTKDLALWIEVSLDNAARIITVLDEFGLGSLGLRAEDFLDPDMVSQLGYEPNRVDFLTKLTGVEFQDAYSKRISTKVGGIEAPMLDRGSLIVNKCALGRPHDLDDMKGIERDDT